VADYLPISPSLALSPEPVLAGSSNPSMAAPSGVELAVRLLMGLELEAT
jgi:hypothetical protein